MSFWFFQYDEEDYLNYCLILERFLSNRVAVCSVIQEFLLSQLYSNSD